MNTGYFKISRKLFDNEIWTSEPFTRGQAWVDLIGLANHKKSFIMVRGIKIELERGDVGWSIFNLAKRWKWSRGKVYRFLELLENEKQIAQKRNNKTDIKLTTVITLINYNLYQSKKQQNGHQTDIKRTSNRTLTINDKNDKNEKNTVGVATNIEISNNQKEIISCWNNAYGKNYKPSLDLENNISYWLKKFTLPEIKTAIKNIKYLYSQEFWRNMRPSLFFRQRNKLGEADYIETALNTDKEKGNTSDELLKQIGL